MQKSEQDKPTIPSKNLFPVVGIGASAGGLDAFRHLIKAISPHSGMAFILVQHLHPSHESALPEILQKETKIPVVEITNKVQVKPDHIYTIPANKLLVANDGILKLSPRPANDDPAKPIDLFFSSLAEVHQSHAIGVVLSGTGTDGTAGLKDIKNHGGLTFAQDPDSAAYDAMPQSAINSEAVDFILQPQSIPPRLMELKESFKLFSSDDNAADGEFTDEDAFRKILALLRVRKGVDFTYYKQTTIRRRLIRRMVILNLEKIADYVAYLKKDKPEQDLLFQDMLIPVTSFFRDPKIFDTLCEKVLPSLLKNKSDYTPLRIWIAGCSTGQEAYSIAMCIHEYLSDTVSTIKVQIFASDISEKAIATVRSGLYPKKELEELSANRLRQFFNKKDGHYQVKKSIRDMCVFACHNFLKDPPFAKMDLISCRNVLIYLEPFLQKKALTTFHYALNEKGILWLGKSEATSSASDLFNPYDKKDKLYTRKAGSGRFMTVVSERNETAFKEKNYDFQSREEKADNFQKSAEDILLSKYTPAGVIVNEQFDIVQFRGSTGEYLEPSPGKASLNVLKMARDGLSFEIRNALHRSKNSSETFKKEGIPINQGKRSVTIEVIPLPGTLEPYFLILFKDTLPVSTNDPVTADELLPEETKRRPEHLHIQQLEIELAQAREDMRSITEEQEAANEELQSANEELLSGSEELQSLNEELETSQEELQSTNEELLTVNQELHDRNEELDQSRRFAEATLATLHEPLLVLNRDFLIKSANDAFYKNFQLSEDEVVGRVLFELQDNGWKIDGLRKELSKIKKEKEILVVVEISHTFPSIGKRIISFNIKPIYRENGEQLILLALNDITARKQAELILKASEKRYEMMVMESPFGFAVLKGKDMVVTLANDAIKEMWGKENELEGRPLIEVLPEFKNTKFPDLLHQVYTTGIPYYAYESPVELMRKDKMEETYFNFIYQPYREVDGSISGVTIITIEVTPQAELNKKLKESESKFRYIANNIPALIWVSDKYGQRNFFNESWQETTGRIPKQDEGMGWVETVHPEDKKSFLKLYTDGIQNQVPFEKEYRLRQNDGKYRWTLCRAIPMYDAESFSGLLGVCYDIHEQKMMEQKKDEFISIAGHEMKTPLTSAKAYLQLLEESLKTTNEESSLFAKKAGMCVERLHGLIVDLLDVSKINNGKLNYNFFRFNFNEMMDNAIEEVQYTSPDHAIIKTGEVAEKVTGDKDRLQQVVINLLSNAIKYSPRSKKVFVHIAQDNKKLTVSVKDTGIGLSKDNLEKIFERYYRVKDNNSINFQGLGIGLFISHEIIGRHNGKLWAESEPGKGSTFYFTLPLS